MIFLLAKQMPSLLSFRLHKRSLIMFYYIKNNTYLQHEKEMTVRNNVHGQSSKMQKGNKDGFKDKFNCLVLLL